MISFANTWFAMPHEWRYIDVGDSESTPGGAWVCSQCGSKELYTNKSFDFRTGPYVNSYVTVSIYRGEFFTVYQYTCEEFMIHKLLGS